MIETRLQMSTVVLFFCLRPRTWLSIYKRLIALALAGGSGTELPASGRIAGGHSERLNSSHRKMENVLHESVSRGRKNPLHAERRDGGPADHESQFLALLEDICIGKCGKQECKTPIDSSLAQI